MNDLNMEILINDYVIPWSIKILLALVIFYIGRLVVGILVNAVRKLMLGRGMDDILVSFLTSIISWVLLLFVVVAALSQLGIDTTSLVALVAAAGLAIGLSLQSPLSNFASGVMLITFRPFTKGNFVEAGGTALSSAITSSTIPRATRGAWTWFLVSPTTMTCSRPSRYFRKSWMRTSAF